MNSEVERETPLIFYLVCLQKLCEWLQGFPHGKGLAQEIWKKHVLGAGSPHDGLFNLEKVNPAEGVVDK